MSVFILLALRPNCGLVLMRTGSGIAAKKNVDRVERRRHYSTK
jgi:hypothetical protein